jgi:hypothetical protein
MVSMLLQVTLVVWFTTVGWVLYGPAHLGELLWDLPAGLRPAPFPTSSTAQHLRHGAGSLADLAVVEFDTAQCRTPSEAAHLAQVWDEAHAVNDRWLLDVFNRALDEALRVYHATPTDARIEVVHRSGPCRHCAAAVTENTAEYRQIVALVEDTPTGEYAVLPDRHPVPIGGAHA